MTSKQELPSGPRVDGGRDHTGRFSPGNKLGRGNPLAGRAAKIRAALIRAVTVEDAKAIAVRLVQQAKTGDLAAIKILLDRTIGPPVALDLLARLEIRSEEHVSISVADQRAAIDEMLDMERRLRAAGAGMTLGLTESASPADGIKDQP